MNFFFIFIFKIYSVVYQVFEIFFSLDKCLDRSLISSNVNCFCCFQVTLIQMMKCGWMRTHLVDKTLQQQSAHILMFNIAI